MFAADSERICTNPVNLPLVLAYSMVRLLVTWWDSVGSRPPQSSSGAPAWPHPRSQHGPAIPHRHRGPPPPRPEDHLSPHDLKWPLY